MTIFRITLLTTLFFMIAFNYCFADIPPRWNVLEESFENEFPPSGWKVESLNNEITWEKTSSAFNGKMQPEDGDYFAFAKGVKSKFVEELLITPKLELISTNKNKIDHAMLYFNFLISEKLNQNHFQVLISFNFTNPSEYTWEKIWPFDYGVGFIDNQPYDWEFFSLKLDEFINKGQFVLAFLLKGETELGIGLDDVYVESTGVKDTTIGDDENDDACGCSMFKSSNVSFSLEILMFLIGFGALAFHRWRRKRL